MPENTKAWWRYIEWLFPILTYIRLRREVGAWRGVLSWLITLIIPEAAYTAWRVEFMRNLAVSISGGGRRPELLPAARTYVAV